MIRHLSDVPSAEACLFDPVAAPPDPALVLSLGAGRALRSGLLPWRRAGGSVIVLTARDKVSSSDMRELDTLFGSVRLAPVSEETLQAALHDGFGASLAREAEDRVPANHSSRSWRPRRAMAAGLAVLAALVVCYVLSPVLTLFAFTGLASGLLLFGSALKIAALVAAGRGGALPVVARDPPDWPAISLLIPLFRETAITDHLLGWLEALDYPRDRLDVCFVLEAGDATTRRALGRARLPDWMRAIVVPTGTIRTKPRALNYALNFARGDIVGVYDAEDAPDPDQLRVVARSFAAAGPDVACLQGILDYYNASANWLTRCFTLEYAGWFRVILPGYARMGLVVPLGGTTLFFRRQVLEELGAWDAHNVTEDADLGLRLARNGYHTDFIPTVTGEEANGRLWPWIRQRSRWLKGYAITYAVHMRDPQALWRDLGPWRFFGVQMLFLGTLAQFLLAPVLWSFWLVPAGLPHPVMEAVNAPIAWTFFGVFIAAEVTQLSIAALAACRAGKGWLVKWALTLPVYFPLGTLAALKGLGELTWRPFFWDKTAHGVLLPEVSRTVPQPARPASGA